MTTRELKNLDYLVLKAIFQEIVRLGVRLEIHEDDSVRLIPEGGPPPPVELIAAIEIWRPEIVAIARAGVEL